MAVSPAMVFYNRYYIHETLLVFFTSATIATGWRYARTGKLAWCLAAGACMGLMQATKETSVIAYLAMGLALMAVLLWTRFAGGESREAGPGIRVWHLVLGLAIAVVVAVTLLSSFFTNLRGPLDGVLTYIPWISRAGGESPHNHPWNHYLHILAWWRRGDGPLWSEGLILALAAVGFVVAMLPAKWRLLPEASVTFTRWAGLYTLLLTAAYSAIPYKTPWCLLEFLQGMILLAGVGAVAVVRLVPTLPLKGLLALVLAAAAGQLAWQAYRASFVLAADPKNPYVYAHSSPDVQRLAGDMEQLAMASPDGHGMLVKVIWNDPYYWPLPWYLRSFEQVGYWNRMPDDPTAPVVISSPKFDVELTDQLDATHLMTGFYGVRPEVLAQLWVRMDVWEAHLRRLGRL
jgi:uncharacterized protein (TIGR03663 family)